MQDQKLLINRSNSLVSAVRNGNLKAVKQLLGHSTLSYSQGWSEGYFLFFEALKNGHSEVADDLLFMRGSQDNSCSRYKTVLHHAILNLDIEIIEMILEQGHYIDAEDEDGTTPIFVAIYYDKMEATELLLRHGASVNVFDSNGHYPLHIAAMKGCLDIVERLLLYGADVDCQSSSRWGRGYAPLHFAVEQGNKDLINLLLRRGANLNAKTGLGLSALHVAVRDGKEEVVELLLKRGAGINDATAESRLTPLHFASEKGQTLVARLLLEHGVKADVNARDRIGLTPILYAISNGYLEMFEILLANGAIVKDVPELLNMAVEKESIEIVKILLEHIDVNASDEYGRTALHFISLKGEEEATKIFSGESEVPSSPTNIKVEITKLLLRKGANVNAQTVHGLTPLNAASGRGFAKVVQVLLEHNATLQIHEMGMTPLHFSAQLGSEEIATLLLDNGADVNAELPDGMTVLHYATRHNHKGIVKLLLERGAAVDLKLHYDFTPLLVGSSNAYAEGAVETLLKFGADINFRNRRGETALYMASKRNRLKNVQTLLKYGFDINVTHRATGIPLIIDINPQDIDGKTPLHYAARRGYLEVVNTLLEYGSDVNITCNNGETPLDRVFSNVEEIEDFYYRSYNPEVFEALKFHFVKMKAANFYLSDSNKNSIVITEEITSFQAQCEKEVAAMKIEKVNASNISFYDILTKCTSSVAMHMRNHKIVQFLKSYDYEAKFPIYARMLDCNFKQAFERKQLNEQGNKDFHSLFKNFPELPYDCIENIFSFLRNKDLRILIIR